jgi:hypothetical protein
MAVTEAPGRSDPQHAGESGDSQHADNVTDLFDGSDYVGRNVAPGRLWSGWGCSSDPRRWQVTVRSACVVWRRDSWLVGARFLDSRESGEAEFFDGADDFACGDTAVERRCAVPSGVVRPRS